MNTSRKFWVEFIEFFKSLPALWNKHSEEYGDRYQRQKAFEALLEKYRELDKDAEIADLKKKINNIRSIYRRECIKIKNSEQIALTPDDIYVPTVWYFPHLDFLKDDNGSANDDDNWTISKMEKDEDDDDDYSAESRMAPIPKKRKLLTTSQVKIERQQTDRTPQNVRTQVRKTPPISMRNKIEPPQIERIQEIEKPRNLQQQYIPKDKSHALSGGWEVLYRDLDERQKLYAYRMINEVLYQAALGKLQENSYKLLEMAVENSSEDVNQNDDGDFETQYYLTESLDNDDFVEKEINGKRRRN
ncbi:uncharacterized protein LOC142234558 [Haematobia irritans]|uniref:uncharacterized protein LOC142234558 n=1 Tax=Haematobia irritans TaxID=7368 RepID=UPI003F5056D7